MEGQGVSFFYERNDDNEKYEKGNLMVRKCLIPRNA